MYKIVLASASPRRKEILEQAGINFEIRVSTSEEITDKVEPTEFVKELAYIKAKEIADFYDNDSIIIGADTVVVLENQIMGKPSDEGAAEEMLQKLQNNIHNVFTGVAILIKTNKGIKKINFAVETRVFVRAMSQDHIKKYISTGEPFDKAGGYGIQGKFAIYIEKIEGDYNNVVGLPISEIYDRLLKENIDMLEI